ncbi:hypothetical protein LIER_08204 [Lithospermum erythrorhizon]|uniref:Uncharacterized protein n=1 Tax=Lithospermum erythrorhizon TaxID=34254 RepID=A0AAV3PBA8_LITER
MMGELTWQVNKIIKIQRFGVVGEMNCWIIVVDRCSLQMLVAVDGGSCVAVYDRLVHNWTVWQVCYLQQMEIGGLIARFFLSETESSSISWCGSLDGYGLLVVLG